MIDFGTQRYAFFALGAAALFGAGTPIAKLLLQDIEPAMLAGLLYLGSGIGLFMARLAGRAIRHAGYATAAEGHAPHQARPPIDRAHIGWLAAAIASGGVVAPLLLMWGLSRSSAAGASLLLNAESVLTTLLAALLFAEHVGRRVWLASLLMLGAGVLLSWSPDAASTFTLSSGALAVIGACFFWGLDNNFTRRIAGGDATTIAMAKGLVAGTVNLLLALAVTKPGSLWPPWGAVAGALLLGAFAYGVSLVLYVRALRHLGSARTGAHFATAPFVGAGIALLMGEPAAPVFLIALALMVLATWLVLTERHAHSHRHEALAHSHPHVHDEHHHHRHDSAQLEAEARAGKAHTHFHVHEPLTHLHPHLPDLHHRHVH
jgi:drug/metabolite transporter (DMT)-like permease